MVYACFPVPTMRLHPGRWGLAGNIVWAWTLTIPCSAFMAWLAWWLARIVLS